MTGLRGVSPAEVSAGTSAGARARACVVVWVVIWVVVAALLAGCAGREEVVRGADAGGRGLPGAGVDVVHGSPGDARSAVIVRGVDVPETAQEGVLRAFELARRTLDELGDEQGEDWEYYEPPAAISPQRAAWYGVDEAINLATIAATPSPPPRLVSVERQRAAREGRQVPPGHLRLYVPGLRERFDIQLYGLDGRMRPEAVRQASQALRDRRSGIARSVSPRLLAMMYLVGQHYDAELEVVSGYRVRGVNASRGSRHGSAEACDFRVPGVSVRALSAQLESMFAKLGSGYYPRSGFVHMDARDVSFYWIDNSGPGQRSRTRARSVTNRVDPRGDTTLRSIHITEEELYQLPPAR